MLKETRKERGCFYGCLGSLTVGGALGAVIAYFAAGSFMGPNSVDSFYLMLRAGYSALGFLAGAFLWGFGSWIYVKFFTKEEEEDVI